MTKAELVRKEMFLSGHLRSALVFLQRGDLPVPPALCSSVLLLLLLHLTHQCHLVEKGQDSNRVQALQQHERKRMTLKAFYFGFLHLGHVRLEFLELLLVLRLVLQQAGVLFLGRLELLQLFVHGAQLLLILHLDPLGLLLRA